MKVAYKEWEDIFDKQVLLSLKASSKAVDKASLVLYNRITQRTPVGDPSLWKWPAPPGYKPGTLRASWVLTKENSTITIYNDQPYAERVEYGWSYIQAPEGMVRISLKEFPKILDDAVKEYKI